MDNKKKVNVHRKSTGRKMLEMFITGDPDRAKQHFIDSIINGFLETAWKSIRSSVEMAVFGRSVSGSSGGSGKAYTSYDSYSREYRDSSDRQPVSRRYRRYEADGITFQSKDVAEDVLKRLYSHIENYPNLSIADYYEIVSDVCDADIPTSFTDNQWGWKKIMNVPVEVNRYGEYVIVLPDPEPLRR